MKTCPVLKLWLGFLDIKIIDFESSVIGFSKDFWNLNFLIINEKKENLVEDMRKKPNFYFPAGSICFFKKFNHNIIKRRFSGDLILKKFKIMTKIWKNVIFFDNQNFESIFKKSQIQIPCFLYRKKLRRIFFTILSLSMGNYYLIDQVAAQAKRFMTSSLVKMF